jgi:hypothetical protein
MQEPSYGLPLERVAAAITGDCGASVPGGVAGRAMWRLPEGVEVVLESNDGATVAGVRLAPGRRLHRQGIASDAALKGFLQTVKMARTLAQMEPAAAH